jgi:prevent-host-death family protein
MAQIGGVMETFSIRDLREKTGDLVRAAEAGGLSVVSKHGHPVFIAVPFDEISLESGLKVSLATKLFREHVVSLGKAAKLAGMTKVDFIGVLGARGIPAVDYPPSELDEELTVLAAE